MMSSQTEDKNVWGKENCGLTVNNSEDRYNSRRGNTNCRSCKHAKENKRGDSRSIATPNYRKSQVNYALCSQYGSIPVQQINVVTTKAKLFEEEKLRGKNTLLGKRKRPKKPWIERRNTRAWKTNETFKHSCAAGMDNVQHACLSSI